MDEFESDQSEESLKSEPENENNSEASGSVFGQSSEGNDPDANDSDDEYNFSTMKEDEEDSENEESEPTEESVAPIDLKEELDIFLPDELGMQENLGVVPCNLDRKLPAKFKRHEFEPIWDGVIYNLSSLSFVTLPDQLQKPLNMTPSLINLELDTVHETEIFCLSPFWDSETYTTQEYINLRNLIIQYCKSHPREYVSLHTCREIAPTIDIVYLAAIHRLLESFNLINNMVNFN